MTASRQRIVKIYDDTSGDFVTLKDDDDGLGLLVIQRGESRVVVNEDQAQLLVQELRVMLDDRPEVLEPYPLQVNARRPTTERAKE